jgi:hypothetical protein
VTTLTPEAPVEAWGTCPAGLRTTLGRGTGLQGGVDHVDGERHVHGFVAEHDLGRTGLPVEQASERLN